MATTNRIPATTLAVGGSASSATVNSSGQQKVVISTQVSALSNPGQIRVDVWDATEGRVLETAVFNVNDTKNIEVTPAPLSYSVAVACTLGSGTVVVNELTGSEQEGLTIEVDDLSAGFFAASAAGRAPFAAGLIDAATAGSVFANGAIPLAKLAGGAVPSLSTVIADPGNAGAIVVGTGTCKLTSAGAETRTLAIPSADGQVILIEETVHVGNIVLTVADPNIDGTNNTVTFSAAGQAILLVAIPIGASWRWGLVANMGTALSHV